MPEPRQPLVFIVSGPSGSGNSTLVHKLLELPGMMFSISCTTRQRRNSEQDGKWYNFISEQEFAEMVKKGEFLEHACVFGRHSYGTPRRWLDEAQAKQLDLVLEIDVQGAAQVKRKLPGSVAIFIMPPSRQSLEERLRSRGQGRRRHLDCGAKTRHDCRRAREHRREGAAREEHPTGQGIHASSS